MEFDRYREAVAERASANGYEPLDARTGAFESVWHRNDEDSTLGEVDIVAAVVDGSDYGPDDVTEAAARLRRLVDEYARGRPPRSTTPLGYLVVAVPTADEPILAAAIRDFTVAKRRANVFPIVYDRSTSELHTHPVPRLKKRGIYRRQQDDAELLFEG